MAILKKPVSANTRSGPAAPLNGSAQAPDLRPYLVTPGRKYTALFPHESEDARLTGETRSLFRRLLALNLPRAAAPVEAVPQLNVEPRPAVGTTALVAIKIA